jgi:uncharacterized ParB-like nuclease family protein
VTCARRTLHHREVISTASSHRGPNDSLTIRMNRTPYFGGYGACPREAYVRFEEIDQLVNRTRTKLRSLSLRLNDQ